MDRGKGGGEACTLKQVGSIDATSNDPWLETLSVVPFG